MSKAKLTKAQRLGKTLSEAWHVRWGMERQRSAWLEGWALYIVGVRSEGSGMRVQPSRSSDANYREQAERFRDDRDAELFVLMHAATGSELHQLALELAREFSP